MTWKPNTTIASQIVGPLPSSNEHEADLHLRIWHLVYQVVRRIGRQRHLTGFDGSAREGLFAEALEPKF